MVRTRAGPPGVRVMRSLITRFTISAGKPRNSATRSRSAGSNAISPRIARSVMAATCSLQPTRSASSSMHSWPIMVESMSATNRRFFRFATGCTQTSTGAGPSASRNRAAMASRSVSGRAKARSAATPGASQAGPAGCGSASAAVANRAPSTAGVAGLAIRVAT